jgi:nucleoid-associated protein YgaU
MYNPLVIFTGAALATLAALMGVTYDKWTAHSAPDQFASSQESKDAPSAPALQNMAEPTDPAASSGPSTELASITPDEPPARDTKTEAPKLDLQKPAAQPEAPPDDLKPTFDTVRIERDGSAVVAGRGKPESNVTVILDGKPLGSAMADSYGAWVLIPDEPVPPGDHELTLRMQREDTTWVNSEQSVALKVPDRAGDEALVVLSDVNQASKVLQRPESSANETEVATAPEDTSAAAAEPTSSAMGDKLAASTSLTLGTVDYNDRGDIIFSGTAEAGSGIRLYVDNKLAGDAAAATDGSWTFADREDIAPGTHSLRVDQLRPDGSVAKRIELPFMRAAPQEVASLNEPTVSAESSKREPQAPAAAAVAEPPATASAEPPAAAPAAMEEGAPNETTVVKTEPPLEETATVQQEPQSVAAAGEAPATDAPTSDAPTTADLNQSRNGKIVIQPGNSLWRISRVIYGRGVEYTTIYQANKEQIRNPNLIYPGQIFATPGVVPPENIDPQSTTPLASSSDSPTSQQ